MSDLGPASASLEKESGIFVSAEGAFGGVVSSHNVVAQKLCDLQKQLEEQIAKEEERRRSEATLAAEEKKKLEEQLEACKALIEERASGIQALIEERASGLQQKTDEAVNGVNVSMESQFKAFQHSLDEVSARQAEIVSRTLPKWEADLNSEVKKVSNDLSSLSSSCDVQFKQIDEHLSRLRAEVDSERAAVESRLGSGLQDAEKRLDAAEGNLQTLNTNLVALEQRSDSSDAELAEKLRSAEERLSASITAEAKAFAEDLKSRMNELESVIKQSDYERLAFGSRTTKELEDLRASIEAASRECKSGVEASSAKLLEEVARSAKEQQSKLTEAVAQLRDACERRDSELASSLSAMEKDGIHRESALSEKITANVTRLDGALQRVEQYAKTEAASVLSAIRADEGRRLAAAESSLREAENQRHQLAARIAQESEERKGELLSSAAALEKRTAGVELVANARFESVRQAVDELATEFQGYVTAAGAQALDNNRLESLVRALEVRVWPWRHHAKDRDGRSPSPQRSYAGTQPAEIPSSTASPDWQSWFSVKSPPKKPTGSRPGSATWRSIRGPREEKDTSGMQVHGSPVGTGSAAARASRGLQSPAKSLLSASFDPEPEQIE